MSKYTPINAVERNRENPDTFWIPPKEDRMGVKTGSHVKLIFEADADGERMWVLVTRNKSGVYKGTLDNHPVFDHDLYHGDTVKFTAENIIAIM